MFVTDMIGGALTHGVLPKNSDSCTVTWEQVKGIHKSDTLGKPQSPQSLQEVNGAGQPSLAWDEGQCVEEGRQTMLFVDINKED